MSRSAPQSLPVAILAGGLATRMRPLTEKVPKALLEVGGKPFIVQQLALLKRNGIREVVLCLGFLGEMVQEIVGDGSRLDMAVHYSFDGAKLLGTGGAIRRALPLLGEQFFVLYGDSYLDIDYGAVATSFLQSHKPALMTVLKNKGQWDRSNVIFEEGKILLYDKRQQLPQMEYIDYGLTVFRAEVFSEYESDTAFDLADVLSKLSRQGDLAGHEVHKRFYEIGSMEGLKETDELLRR